MSPKPLHRSDGDIKLSPLQRCESEFFKYDSPAGWNLNETTTQNLNHNPVSDFERFKNPPINPEGFLCHHDFPEGVSADDIRISLANHTAIYVRSLLCAVSQIAYHLCRQVVAGITSASHLSGLLAARMLPILTSVRYSCHWAERQMKRWWKAGMSASTFRRIRDDLESWGCFEIDRVAPGSTRQVTPLRQVNLPRLLKIASFAFQRLCAEPDGWDNYVPGHRCGFLASLWKLFFPGTLYAPDEPAPGSTAETELLNKQAELLKVRELAEEHAWSDFLASQYREVAETLERQIRNLEVFLAAQEVIP